MSRIFLCVVIRTEPKFVESPVGSCNLNCDGYDLTLHVIAHNSSGGEKPTWSLMWFNYFVIGIAAHSASSRVHQPLPLLMFNVN